ncbi:hypothetical protein HZC32_02885, partial [Candidatus Woesearchaeota archaeon]|nr:hypothetical protein [Candidatus Woesearchaeota archaeon]
EFKDFGQVVSNSKEEYICLNKNSNLVGREGTDILGWDATRCPGEWCWINAVGDARFNILTIKKFGEEPYDVVSNNEDWFECKATSPSNLSSPKFGEVEDEKDKINYAKITNRYYCHQEGNHWSWAECHGEYDAYKNSGIKGRYTGEGLYSLSIPGADELGEKSGVEVKIGTKDYINFYGKDYSFDFTGYDYLEFMIKFVAEDGTTDLPANNLKLPVGAILQIDGPDKLDANGKQVPLKYYNQDVLGYATNPSQLTKGGWMHIKVPITGFKGVTQIAIKSTKETNLIRVKNIYLTKKDSPAVLCSGKESETTSSWLTNIDQSSSDTYITGEDLCNKLYGENAWLGGYEEVEEPDRYCCGNNENEYYSGPSKDGYGCWNSQVIAPGQTTMNTEFEVEYASPEQNIIFPTWSETVKIDIIQTDIGSTPTTCPKPLVPLYGKCVSQSPQTNPTETIYVFKPISIPLTYADLSVSPKMISLADYAANLAALSPAEKVKISVVSEKGGTQLPFEIYNSISGNLETPDKLYAAEELPNLQVVFSLPPSYEIPNVNTVSANESMTISYSCSQEECLYPLPGLPPYHITNLHPELYELWFVSKSDEKVQEEWINPSGTYNQPGNIKVKKAAQQVIFINNEDQQGFYGCQAADYLKPLLTEGGNLPHCSVLGGKFCSYTTKYESGKDWFTAINSWSSENLTKVGYNLDELDQQGNISSFYETLELKLVNESHLSEERNHSSVVLPARNFLPNPEFKGKDKDIYYWEIYDNEDLTEKELSQVTESTVTLKYGQKIRSEKIAVEKNLLMWFTQNSGCWFIIYLVDKEGIVVNKDDFKISNKSLTFNAANATYLILELYGPCKLNHPMLQLIDELGPVDYLSLATGLEGDPRAAVACCPENYCWNGYACVKPMSKSASLAEHISAGRDYRCIDGIWKHVTPKTDWTGNADNWGFCPNDEQCFVLKGGGEEHTAKDFYQDKIPMCINTSEYIFDHYCSLGNWTSRTKLIAQKLLKVAENQDYVLYCDHYSKTLLELDNKENYIGGPDIQTPSPANIFTSSITEPFYTNCFKEVSKDENIFPKLISEKENTCINNVCVLKYKEGDEYKVVFATTLNRAIDDAGSFLNALNVPLNKIKTSCSQEGKTIDGEEYNSCDLGDIKRNLWYLPKLGAVIYGREEVDVGNPDEYTFEKVVKMVANFVGKIIPKWLSEESSKNEEVDSALTFMHKHQNTNRIYLLQIDDKKVQATQEVLPGGKHRLEANYFGFNTSLCDYVDQSKIGVPPELKVELLEHLSNMDKFTCSNATGQQVEAIVSQGDVLGLDFLWPQLTSKLRVEEQS